MFVFICYYTLFFSEYSVSSTEVMAVVDFALQTSR